MEVTNNKKSSLEIAIRILYQFMLTAGILIVAFAFYLIHGGTVEAIIMIIPGLLALGGGLVLRKISSVNKFA